MALRSKPLSLRPPRRDGRFARACSPFRGCSFRGLLRRATLPATPFVAEVGVGGGPFCPGRRFEATDGDDVGLVGLAEVFGILCGGRFALAELIRGLAVTVDAMITKFRALELARCRTGIS